MPLADQATCAAMARIDRLRDLFREDRTDLVRLLREADLSPQIRRRFAQVADRRSLQSFESVAHRASQHLQRFGSADTRKGVTAAAERYVHARTLRTLRAMLASQRTVLALLRRAPATIED